VNRRGQSIFTTENAEVTERSNTTIRCVKARGLDVTLMTEGKKGLGQGVDFPSLLYSSLLTELKTEISASRRIRNDSKGKTCFLHRRRVLIGAAGWDAEKTKQKTIFCF